VKITVRVKSAITKIRSFGSESFYGRNEKRSQRATKQQSWPSAKAAQYAFAYDDETISELERTIAQTSGIERSSGDS
jgi:hypothetical protein